MFKIVYCGYNICNPNYDTISRPNGSGDYLFLLFTTPFYIRFGNETVTTKPNACLLYTPNASQHYQAVKKFQNSFIHFKADTSFFEKYKIPLNQIHYYENYSEINQLIKEVSIEYITKNIYYEQKLNTLMEQLFISISRQLHTVSLQHGNDLTLFEQFQQVRLQMLTNCETQWNIEQMCKLINLEKSQFFAYYSRFFNTTPKADLLNARIDKAKMLLTNEVLQIHQIAELCGFSSISHFTRYFKKTCGSAPSNYSKFIKE
jgi:AraC-like DNA-binding protein